MTPSLWFLAGSVAVILAVDILFCWGHLPGGTISLAMARLYRATAWARPAFWLGSAALIAGLDWHFSTYCRP